MTTTTITAEGEAYAASLLAALDTTHALAGQSVRCNTTPPVLRGRVADRFVTLQIVGSIDGCMYGHDDDERLVGVAEWAVVTTSVVDDLTGETVPAVDECLGCHAGPFAGETIALAVENFGAHVAACAR